MAVATAIVGRARPVRAVRPMSRALGYLCISLFTVITILAPASAYAIAPALVGIAVRTVGGRVVIPLAEGLARAVPMAPKIVGLSPLGWVTVTSLGIQAGKELMKMVPAGASDDSSTSFQTVDAGITTASPSIGWVGTCQSQSVVFATADEALAWTIKQPTCFTAGTVATSPCVITGTSASCPVRYPSGYTMSLPIYQGQMCSQGSLQGGVCVIPSCPPNFDYVGGACKSRQAMYQSDGIPTAQAVPGGGWRADPRDPDPLPPELVEWLNNGFITKDNFGNTVQMPKPTVTADGGYQLQFNVEGLTLAGEPTLTMNKITVGPNGQITGATSETIYGSIGKPSEQKPIEFPDDYSREKTLKEAKEIMDRWVKADQEMQTKAQELADGVKDKIKLKDEHWKLDALGLPAQGIFETPGVGGMADKVPGGGSCVRYSMSLGKNPFVVDPCPWLPYYKPTLDWFVIASGVITSVFMALRVSET